MLRRSVVDQLGGISGQTLHAKAGNINSALKETSGELLLILDCDHIPAAGRGWWIDLNAGGSRSRDGKQSGYIGISTSRLL